MVDERLVQDIIEKFAEFEYWNPWHEFKFAEAARLNMRFFLPPVHTALRECRSPEVATPEIEWTLLQALRKHAREERDLPPEAVDRSDSWNDFFPDPNLAKNIKQVSKSGRDIRRYTQAEIDQTIGDLEEKFPEIVEAIRVGTRHNVLVDPSCAQGSQADIDTYRFTFQPIRHAIFQLHPGIDSLDNSELAHRVFDTLFARFLGK